MKKKKISLFTTPLNNNKKEQKKIYDRFIPQKNGKEEEIEIENLFLNINSTESNIKNLNLKNKNENQINRSSISILNSLMMEALSFNTNNSNLNNIDNSISVDLNTLRKIKKNSILKFSNLKSENESNKKSLNNQNLLSQLNSIIKNKTIQKLKNEKIKKRENPKLIKILEAPNIKDDFYYNIIDWGIKNIISIPLNNSQYLYNPETNKTEYLFSLDNNILEICSTNFMNNGYCLAIGLSNGNCLLYDIEKKIKIRQLNGHKENNRICSLSWNNYILTTGSKDTNIINHDVRDKNHIINILKGHQNEICSLKWNYEGNTLISGGNDNLLCIWDINGLNNLKKNTFNNINLNKIFDYPILQPKFCLTKHISAIKAINFSLYERNIIVSCGGKKDKSIKFWNYDNGTLIKDYYSGNQICNVFFNKFEKELITCCGYNNNQICFYKYPKMKKFFELRGHLNRILYSVISPDGCTLLTASPDETIRFWNINDFDQIYNEVYFNKDKNSFCNLDHVIR
jgi:cell division cycle protein 20 (cofactor of APC complex)